MTDNLVYTSETSKASHTKSPNRLVRVAAEFAGTAFIVFAIYAISTWGALLNSSAILLVVGLGTALAYAAATLTFGRASGGHFNPAVTLTGVLTGVIDWIDGLTYLCAQVLGGLAAAGVWYVLTPVTQNLTLKTWITLGINGYDKNNPMALLGSSSNLTFGIRHAIAIELIFTVIVVAAFYATVRADGSARKNHVGAIAAAYGIGAMSAYIVDGAGLNPARSTGLAVVAHATKALDTNPLTQLWVFWVVPLVAAAVVAFGFIIRDSVQAQRAETEAAVAALRLEQEAEAAAQEDDDEEVIVDEESHDAELPEVVIETEASETQSDEDESHE